MLPKRYYASGVRNLCRFLLADTGDGLGHSARAWETGVCHRYLMRALPLYVDLRSDSPVPPVLTSAADAAIGAKKLSPPSGKRERRGSIVGSPPYG